MSGQERIGVIGLGRMGSAICQALKARRFAVGAWNRSPREDEARRIGVPLHDSIAGLTRSADILIMSLFDDAAVQAVSAELVSLDLKGRLVVDTSTVRPDTLRGFSGQFAAAGAGLVDAPISGGPELVLKASAGIFAGGSEEDVARFRPVAEAFCSSFRHIGPMGAGASAKIVNNMLLMGQWEALREAMLVGRRAGLEARTILDIICEGPGGTPAVRGRIPEILGESPRVGFSVSGLAKDAALFLSVAKELGVEAPAILSAERQLRALEAKGYGGDDLAAFVRETPRDQ